jgi:uncharacterized protein
MLHARSRATELLAAPFARYWCVAAIYLFSILLAEGITTLVDPQAGMILHGVVLFALLFHSAVERQKLPRRFLTLLALAPLIRILSLALPLAELGLPTIYWYMVVGLLLYVAAYFSGRVTGFGWRRMGWTWKHWPIQLVFGVLGFGLGFFEYLILRPSPIVRSLALGEIWIPALILLIFTGLLEEIIFRGMLQSASMQLLGKYGLVFIAVLFAILHLGYFSILDLLFVLSIGLFFGWVVWKFQWLLGVSVAHGFTNFSLYILFPVIFSAQAVSSGPVDSSAVAENSGSQTLPAVSAFPVASLFDPGYRGSIVDNDEPGYLSAGTATVLDSTRGYKGNYRWTSATESLPTVVATWIPNLIGCGIYEVRVYIPPVAGSTESAHYQINHNHGIATVILNQADRAGAWASLGIYEFEPSHLPSLQLSNFSRENSRLSRWVGFDAAWWAFVRPCAEATPDGKN